MAVRLVAVSGLCLALRAPGSQSFLIPTASPGLHGRGVPSPAQFSAVVAARPSLSDTVIHQRTTKLRRRSIVHELSSTACGSGNIGSSNAEMNRSSLGDVEDSAYRPTRLWWTKSRAEEDATVNLVANGGFIVAVVVFALMTLFSVDVEVSRGWTASEFILRVPIDNWLAYTSVLRDNPVLVKACTSGIVYALGDWTAQTFEGVALADIKRGRVFRSAFAGLALHGPLSHVWYGVCEGLFDLIGWNDAWWVTFPKIMTDQLFWGPFWNAVYISFLGLLKRDSAASIWEAITSTAVPLVLAGLRLWPLAHVITYGLVPTENRLLWVDFVEIIWVTILSRQAADQARAAGGEPVLTAADEDRRLASGNNDSAGSQGGMYSFEGEQGIYINFAAGLSDQVDDEIVMEQEMASTGRPTGRST